MKKETNYFLLILLFIFFSCDKQQKLPDNYINDTIKKTIKNNDSLTGKVNKLFAISRFPTPVLNTKDFSSVYGGKNGASLKRAKNGLIKELEYVAFPGSVFEILEKYPVNNHFIYKIHTEEYDISDLDIELFIDSRFVDTTNVKPQNRIPKLPDKNKIYDYLEKSLGAKYVWGANNIEGVDLMLEFYKPQKKLSESEIKEWSMKGVDCSGLMYEATDGYIARNTHQLVYFGKPVIIEGLSVDNIIKTVKPLDLIVWKGHVIIVFDSITTIESSFSAKKVIKKNLSDVLKKIIKKRKPVNEWKDDNNSQFVIRRWFEIN